MIPPAGAVPEIPLDRGGFLDPSAAGVIPATTLAGAAHSFVLLAPGGAGKTTLLHELRRLEDGVAVDLVGLERAEIEPVVAEAAATGRPVYIDSLDEADSLEPAMFRRLRRAMRQPGAAGVTWRLACRPAAWHDVPAPALTAYRLLPLSRDAAADWLATAEVGEEFLDALTGAGSQRLAGSALHFIAAARRWHRRGHLSARPADILESEVRRLLAEREEVREPLRVPADLRRRAAGRLAAFGVFSGVNQFAFRGTHAGTAISVGELPSAAEPDRPDYPFGREVHEEVLGSALFESGTPGSVVFRHQVYADYLAAAYVSGREPTFGQLSVVLGMTGGVLPRAMSSVAAWIAALRPEVAERLAAENVRAFLESGVDFPASVRAALVRALLAAAREARLDPVWSVDLAALDHPGLAEQLAAYVAGPPAGDLEAWWLCRIALACRVTAVVPFAIEAATTREWFAWARRPAIAVVLRLGTGGDREALHSRLSLRAEDDPDDELLAAVIDGMYPEHLPLAEILPMVHPPRAANHIGAYKFLLADLPRRVPPAELTLLLSWAVDRLADDELSGGPWDEEFVSAAVTRAFAHLHEPGLLAALSDLLVEARLGRRFDPPWTDRPAQRRELAVAVAERSGEHWWKPLHAGLLVAGDGDWLAANAATFPAAARPVLARCRAKLLQPPAEVTEPRDDLGTGRDRAHLADALTAARGDVALWWQVANALAGDDSPEMVSFDLTTRPGWSWLTPAEQRDVLDLGHQYVMRHRPEPESWLGQPSYPRAVFRDWTGVYLLATLAEHDRERLATLPGAIWSRWAPVIGGVFPYYLGEPLEALLAQVPGDARDQVLHTVRELMESRPDWWRTPQYEYFAEELLPTLVGYLEQRRFDDGTSADVLDFVLRHSTEDVPRICRDLAGDDDSRLARRARRHLAETEPRRVAESILADRVDRDVLRKRVAGLRLTGLATDTLGALTELLFDSFPLAEDPDLPDRLDDPALQVRSGAVELLAERGETRILERLARDRIAHEVRYLRHFSERARVVAAEQRATRLSPADLLLVLGRADVRLVQNSRDLLDAVVDHLTELQHELTHRNAFHDLWSRDLTDLGSEDDISDWVQRHLEKRLTGGVIDREVQVQRRSKSGIGTRTDLMVSARSATAAVDVARVVIEAKLVNNPEIRTATRDQLIDRYLTAMDLRHGLLLVYWVDPGQRPSRWNERTPAHPDAAALLAELRRQAADAPAGYDVRPFVLDVSRPAQRR